MRSNTFFVSRKRLPLVNLTRTAILMSMSLVVNLIFMFYIPIAGFQAVKVTFSGAIDMIVAIVCGPVYGMICGALVDIITCIIKPAGAYFPGFTIAAAISSLIPGLIFKYMKKDNINYNLINSLFISILSIGCVAVFVTKGFLTIQNNALYYNGKPLSIFYIIGFVVLVVAYIVVPIILAKKLPTAHNTNKILFSVSLSRFVTSILLNTWFLSIIMGKGFIVFLPGRILANFFIIPIYTFVISTVLTALDKLNIKI